MELAGELWAYAVFFFKEDVLLNTARVSFIYFLLIPLGGSYDVFFEVRNISNVTIDSVDL